MIKAAIKQFFSRKNSFLRNMLITTVGLICVPLVAIQLLIIHQSTREFKTNNTNTYLSALQTNSNTYQMQLQMLSETALRMSQDSVFASPLRPNASIYTQLTTVKQLDSYKYAPPFSANVAIYYRDLDYVLTTSNKQTLQNFCSGVTGSDSEAAAQLYGFLDTITTQSYSAKYDQSGYILFAKPVSLLSAARHDAVVCFLLNTKELSKAFSASIPHQASFGIINNSGQLALNSPDFPLELLSNQDFLDFLVEKDAPSCQLRTELGELNLYKYTDPVSGYTSVASVGTDAADQTISRYASRLHLTVGISLVFMCILLVASVYINYRPVKKLVSQHAPDHTGSNLTEFELLDSVFFAKDERISSQNSLLSSFLISDLLFGVEIDRELMNAHFPEDQFHSFCVAAVSRLQLNSAQANSVSKLLRSQLTPAEVYTTSLPNSPRILFIFMSEKELNQELLKSKILFAVDKITGKSCSIQLGEAVESIWELPRSHQGALAVNLPIDQPANIPSEDPHLTKEIQLFTQYVCSGDQANALAALERAEGIIASGSTSVNYRNYYCYKLLLTYLSSIRESSVSLTEADMEPLLAFQHPAQLFALLRQSAISCCKNVQKANQSSNAQVQSKLLQYVNDNLTSSELCLTSTADHLKLSIYTVSRLFKEYTQQNFKEYITGKRLEMALDLLTTTDQTISEIANSVGFEDASYFSEVFKKHYGVVPTKMRNAQNAGK